MIKVSVIVATYKDDESIGKTIKSFLSQTYKNKELIVVDGGSQNGAEKMIGKYKDKIVYCQSQPRGVADAFNVGIKAAGGDYLYFMGSGDYLWDKNVLKKIMSGVDPKKDVLICGKINRVSQDGKNILYTSSLNFQKWMLLYKMGLPHQGLFTNKTFFERYGEFDVNCKYAMDYELLLRAYREFPKPVMKDVVVAGWVEGGIGQNNTDKVMAEYHRIRLKNKIVPRWLLEIIYMVSKWRYGIYK